MTQAQRRVIKYLKMGGVISCNFKSAQIEVQRIPYKFSLRTLKTLLKLGFIDEAGNVQFYKKSLQ